MEKPNKMSLLAWAFDCNILDKSGLREYIKYLRGEIKEINQRILATTAEGTAKEPRKKDWKDTVKCTGLNES